jgi:hypothetical protein
MDRFAFNFILFFYNDEDVDPALQCVSARLGKTLGMRRKFCARSRYRQGRGIRLERILQLVARATRDKERLSVRQELASPATLHARLKSMRDKGWITLADTEDPRRNQIELFQAGLRHFDKLSVCFLNAAEEDVKRAMAHFKSIR